MGLLNGLMGNATKANVAKVEKALNPILIAGEEVNIAYQLVRDQVVFTDKRLIIVNKQGVTGKKTSYQSFPYNSISRFTVETAGHFDLDSELKIYISGSAEPAASLQFREDNSVIAIQQALATAVLGGE